MEKIYYAENLFIIPNEDNSIKSIMYFMVEDHKSVVRIFNSNYFVDHFLSQSPESKVITTDLKKRIKINNFLENNGFKWYIKETYDRNDISLFYNALVRNVFSIVQKKLFDRLATNAAIKWCQVIDFVDTYDLSFLANNPLITTITDPNTSIPSSFTKTELQFRFRMGLIAQLKILLYALGKDYELLKETTKNPCILRKIAEQVNIKGYVRNDISMSLRNGQVFLEIVPANVISMADYKKNR